MSKPKFLVMNVAGTSLPLLQTQVKPRPGDTEIHTYYCFREPTRTSGAFGVKIEPASEQLPTQVEIDGVVVSLERGLTAASYTEKRNGQSVTVVVPEDKRRPRVASKTFQTFPNLADGDDTGIRNVDVSISETNDGLWNVKVVVNRSGLNSVSPQRRRPRTRRRRPPRAPRRSPRSSPSRAPERISPPTVPAPMTGTARA